MLAAFKLRAVPINVNYRYVEDELRYLLDDADAARGRLPPRVRAEARRDPRRRSRCSPTFVAVDDDSGADVDARSTRVDYEAALAAASPGRDFGPRSADDLYILYTGGTTGMPKGVMWRHEDIFFGAIGGAGGGGDADHHARGDRRALPRRPPHALRARVPVHARHRALDGVQHAVHRRHRRHLRPSTTSTRSRSGSSSSASAVNFLVIVGDAFARPLLDALDTGSTRRLDVSRARACCSPAARSSRRR